MTTENQQNERKHKENEITRKRLSNANGNFQ